MIADHVVARTWRHAQADALEAQIESIGEALAHLDNIEDLLTIRSDGDAAEALRRLTALLRDRANTMRDEARVLRAAGRE
jgi:hypothetical protein